MVNLLLTYDNLDGPLGEYFQQSKEHSIGNLNGAIEELNWIDAPTYRCNVAYLDIVVPQLNQRPFILLNYSHGCSTAIINDRTNFISNDNIYLFTNALAYVMSCEVAAELGTTFIDNNALAFIGFDRTTYVLRGEYQPLSILCDNYGLILFVNGYKLQDAFAAMKAHYTSQSHYLESIGEPFKAADLLETGEALKFYGNGDLIISDFM